jgi:hypothetical protein
VSPQQIPLPGFPRPPTGTGRLALRGLLARFLGSAVSNSAGYAVGGAVLPTLEPLTQDLANETWSHHQVKPLPLGPAAEGVARGLWAYELGEQESNYQGYNSQRFQLARDLAQHPPPAESLIDLRNRGIIGDAELDNALEREGMLPYWRSRFAELRHVLPTVTDMIRFAVREVYDPAQRQALNLDAELPAAFVDDAARLGMTPAVAGQHWAAHWQLPSYEQGVAMLFRGELSQAQFAGLLKALDYAPVWRPRLEAIARRIPPIDDMIRFAVRDVYSPDTRQALGLDADFPPEFASEAALHGMDDERTRQYWAAHWRLPSALQGYRMLWRGEINEAQLNMLLKALDYPPFWREKLSNIARIVPGRIDLKRMLRHDILNREQVEAGYRRLGYAAEDAERMTRIAVAELQTAGAVTAKWAERARSRLFTAAHGDYMDGNADEAAARAMLTEVGATATEQDTIIRLWNVERTLVRRDLTQAQIIKLYKKSLWPREQAHAALLDLGMEDVDANALLDAA